VEINVRCSFEFLLKFVDLVESIIEAERRREGEVSGFIGTIEHMAELKHELVLLEEVTNFSEQSTPYFLSRWQYSKHWL
jgi:hypothetical protein